MAIIDGVAPNYTLGTAGDDKITAQYLQGDKIQGLEGNDTIIGLSGNDLLFGGVGNDRVNGNEGNDHLNGGTGNDRVDGGDGNDTIIGGAGTDKLTGGAGADVFEFLAQTDSFGTERDIILDFNSAEGDKIELSFLNFHTNAYRTAFLGAGEFTANGLNIPEIRVVVQGGKQLVEIDRHGDGIADFQLLVDTKVALAGGDFII